MTKASLLIVEDEKDIAELMALHLLRDGHQVSTVENGEEALLRLSQEKYDLLILDWMLPGLNGPDVCQRLQRKTGPKIPVLMVTARASSTDVVAGLEAGADDYVTKPFEIPVLIARVRALLRREPPGEAGSFKQGGLWVDTETYRVKCEGKEVALTLSEFRLLAALMRASGKVLTRERLIDEVQGADVNVTDRTIDTHIFGLRKKLGRCADHVETIRGVGYRLNIPN